MLELNDVCFTTKDKRIFIYSCKLAPPCVVGLAGAACSGKSLFLDLISGKVKHQSGEILYYKNAINRRFSRKKIKVFPHTDSLADDTVCEQIRRPRNGVTSAFVEKYLPIFFTNSNLMRSLLSTSQRQIADILQAASGTTEILLLDSPDTTLDPVQKPLLASFIREYNMAMRRIILIASSDINFLCECCDSILFFQEGRISDHLNPDKITEEFLYKIYHTTCSLQISVLTGRTHITFDQPV